MENPPDPRPVYEADQVLTVYDLIGIRNGYVWKLRHTPWYDAPQRFIYKIAVNVLNEMLHWLAHGKPPGGVKCGGHYEG